MKHFKALKILCGGLGKRFLAWEKPLRFSGLFIFPPPANPLLQPIIRYFTERAGAGTHSPTHKEAALSAALPAPGKPGYLPKAWKKRPTALSSELSPLLPVQAALEEPSSFALYFQSRSLLAAHLYKERSRRFAPSFSIRSTLKPKFKLFQRFFIFFPLPLGEFQQRKRLFRYIWT